MSVHDNEFEEAFQKARAREARVARAVDDALNGPRASAELNGLWEGFTQGRALAWCWVLAQFESGNMLGHWRSPEPRLRREALQAGKIPNGNEFPRRARELEGKGLTPITYRHYRETLGYTPTTVDVR